MWPQNSDKDLLYGSIRVLRFVGEPNGYCRWAGRRVAGYVLPQDRALTLSARRMTRDEVLGRDPANWLRTTGREFWEYDLYRSIQHIPIITYDGSIFVIFDTYIFGATYFYRFV